MEADYIKKETLCTELCIEGKDMKDMILNYKFFISIKKIGKNN